MELMTNFELETFLKMLLLIMDGSKSLEEAKDKIRALLDR